MLRLPSITLARSVLVVSCGDVQNGCRTLTPSSLIATTVCVDGGGAEGGIPGGKSMASARGWNGGGEGGRGLVLRQNDSKTSGLAIAHSPARNVEHLVVWRGGACSGLPSVIRSASSATRRHVAWQMSRSANILFNSSRAGGGIGGGEGSATMGSEGEVFMSLSERRRRGRKNHGGGGVGGGSWRRRAQRRRWRRREGR